MTISFLTGILGNWVWGGSGSDSLHHQAMQHLWKSSFQEEIVCHSCSEIRGYSCPGRTRGPLSWAAPVPPPAPSVRGRHAGSEATTCRLESPPVVREVSKGEARGYILPKNNYLSRSFPTSGQWFTNIINIILPKNPYLSPTKSLSFPYCH